MCVYIYICTLDESSYSMMFPSSKLWCPSRLRSAKARRFASATRLGWLASPAENMGYWWTLEFGPCHSLRNYMILRKQLLNKNCVQETATEHCVAFIWTGNQSMLDIWQNRAIAWACFGRKADFCSFSGNTLGPISATRTTLGLHPSSAQTTVILALCLWDAGRFADGELIITVWTEWRHVKTCQDM